MYTTIETKDQDIRVVPTSSIVEVYMANTASRKVTAVTYLLPGAGTGVVTFFDIADLKQHRDIDEALAFASSRMLALKAAEEGQAQP